MSIISISRGAFSGGQVLAECVAERLGYQCISREVLIEAARSHGVPVDKLAQALDEVPGILHHMSLERVHYHVYTVEALVKAAQDERVVYHGLAGHVLLRDVPNILRIRVIASMESRIEMAMGRLHCGWDEAAEFIRNSDKRRDKWVRLYQHVHSNDPSLYDLVINLEHVSLASACEIVCVSASQKEFQPTLESQKRLRDLALSSEVRAKIAQDGDIADSSIEIEADDGVITIGGTAYSLADADRIRELVRQAPGVKDIESRMRVRAEF